ncbi:MAG: phosphoribosylaminoimidazolesuccinocarboxamide synthase, partial [Acidimicrobiales bacterium]
MNVIHSGKVREIYDAGPGRLFMVASDRISAFDVVAEEPIPDKGRVLTAMTAFWLGELADIAPNHMISCDPAEFPPEAPPDAAGRAMLVRRAEMLPIECIVRGYLSGSAWKEYQSTGRIHAAAAPRGLVESDRLPEPMFTPSTKATAGHDENIDFARAAELIGLDLAIHAR